jgi:tetrahydromethanopterin S-methyltransferase subunit B
MAVDLTGLRDAVEAVATKINNLRDAIAAAGDSGVIQAGIDEIKGRVEELGTEIDSIIDDLTPDETPTVNPLQ